MSIVALLLISLLALSPWADAATRIGLFVTEEEATIWRTRATNGPYRVAGDVQTNSPGEWTRIKTNADAFRTGTTERWSGNTGTTCYTNANYQSTPRPNPSQGRNMRDAAFVYATFKGADSGVQTSVLGRLASEYRDPVITELLAMAGLSGLQWGGSRWTCSGQFTVAHNPAIELSAWMGKMIFAYDLVRGDMTGGQQTTMDAWFLAFVTRFLESNYKDHVESRWPNRGSDDYSSTPSPCPTDIPLYYQGPNYCDWFWPWDNTHINGYRTMALIAIVINNATLKTEAKRFVKEVVRYQMWSNGSMGDTHRWNDGFGTSSSPCHKGFGYPSSQLGGTFQIAEAFARLGDLELYEYTSSVGQYGTAGGTKSLLLGATTHINRVNGTVAHFATTSATQAADSRYRIDSDCGDFASTGTGANYRTIADVWLAIANRHYKNTNITSGYRRQRSGDPAYPSSVPQFSGNATYWEGPEATLPGVLFMWGQMENQNSPYISTGDTTPPNPPTSVTATAASSSQIDLGWTAGAGEAAATYEILWCQNAGCTPAQLITIPGPATSYSHTGLLAETLYRYQLRAVDAAGNPSTYATIAEDTTETVPAPALDLHFTFDTIDGTTISDETANNHDGTTSGSPATEAGEIDNALVFDGVDDSVRVTRHANLEPTALTVCAWIARDGSQTGQVYYLLTKTHTNDASPTFTSYALRVNDGGAGSDVISFVTGFDGGRHVLSSSAGALPDGVYTHVCGRYNPTGPSPQKSLWINGNLIASAIETRALVYDTTSTGDLYLGNNGAGRLWRGSLDDVRIYDGAISDADIAELALGTPAAVGVFAQPSWRWRLIDELETGRWQRSAGVQGRIVQGNNARVRLVVSRTVDTSAPTEFALYARSPAGSGTWYLLDDDCDANPFCYGFDRRLENGLSTTAQVAAAEDFSSGGKFYKAFGTRLDQISIGAGKSAEYEMAIRAAPDTALDATVGLCLRIGDGTELDSCSEATAVVVAPASYGP